MFKRGDLLTLTDDNEYAVVDCFNMDGAVYMYLVDINNNENILYCTLENNKISEIKDPNLLNKVILKINENLHQNA